MISEDRSPPREAVSLFGITFPRWTLTEASTYILSQIRQKRPIAVCFPDMSMLNLVNKDPTLGALIEQEFLPLNDGIGLKIASTLEGKSFLENLNGTDFIPKMLQELEKGTTVFLVGSKDGVAQNTLRVFSRLFPHVNFVGSSHGYLNPEEEPLLVKTLEQSKPMIVLVGMGNPLQLHWIHRYRHHPAFAHTAWFAVGGLFDFYGGGRVRAPAWMRSLGLEWLHIIFVQPHKFWRYAKGIPLFLSNTLSRTLWRSHKKISGI